MKCLKIELQNENTQEYFDIYYKLLSNSCVDKFIKLINQINEKKQAITQFNNFCINVGDIKLIKNEKYNELIKNIELFENENNNNYTRLTFILIFEYMTLFETIFPWYRYLNLQKNVSHIVVGYHKTE